MWKCGNLETSSSNFQWPMGNWDWQHFHIGNIRPTVCTCLREKEEPIYLPWPPGEGRAPSRPRAGRVGASFLPLPLHWGRGRPARGKRRRNAWNNACPAETGTGTLRSHRGRDARAPSPCQPPCGKMPPLRSPCTWRTTPGGCGILPRPFPLSARRRRAPHLVTRLSSLVSCAQRAHRIFSLFTFRFSLASINLQSMKGPRK